MSRRLRFDEVQRQIQRIGYRESRHSRLPPDKWRTAAWDQAIRWTHHFRLYHDVKEARLSELSNSYMRGAARGRWRKRGTRTGGVK